MMRFELIWLVMMFLINSLGAQSFPPPYSVKIMLYDFSAGTNLVDNLDFEGCVTNAKINLFEKCHVHRYPKFILLLI